MQEPLESLVIHAEVLYGGDVLVTFADASCAAYSTPLLRSMLPLAECFEDKELAEQQQTAKSPPTRFGDRFQVFHTTSYVRFPQPVNTRKLFAIGAADILEGLLCLNHLTCEEANDPGKVRQYADMAGKQIQAMRELVRPMLWSPSSPEALLSFNPKP